MEMDMSVSAQDFLEISHEMTSEECEAGQVGFEMKTDQFECANCSMSYCQTQKLTDFIFCDPQGQGDEIKITVLEAVSEIFSIKLEPLLVSCYEDLKLCSTCGYNLIALYKCFKEFTRVSTLESIITGLIKMDPNIITMENETKMSLRKNPKQLVRFDYTSDNSSSRRNSIKSKQSGTRPGTSSGWQDDSDDNTNGYGAGSVAIQAETTTASSLDIGVTSQGQYYCLSCRKSFPTRGGVTLHMGFKHNLSKDEVQQQCNHPSIKDKMDNFKKTDKIQPKRRRRTVPKEDRIPLPCPHCNKSSWNSRDLNNHISSVHLKIKPFSCPLCEKAFSRKQQVEAHLKVHSGEKTSLCYLCGKAYSSAGALKGHLDRHFPRSAPPTNTAKFKCNLCNVQCTDMRRLNEHKLRHQDERNFPCDHCEKAFKTRRDLVKHRNYHTLKLLKPEQCPACEKRYSTKEILKFHLHSTHQYSLEDARSAAGIGQAAVVVYDEDNNMM